MCGVPSPQPNRTPQMDAIMVKELVASCAHVVGVPVWIALRDRRSLDQPTEVVHRLVEIVSEGTGAAAGIRVSKTVAEGYIPSPPE